MRHDPALSPVETIRRRDGYDILSAVGPELGLLPADCGPGHVQREGYISVLAAPQPVPDGTRQWRGKVDVTLLLAQFPADPTLREMARLDYERFDRQWKAGERIDTPARFVERPDGGVTLEQVLGFGGAGTLTLREERVSPSTIV